MLFDKKNIKGKKEAFERDKAQKNSHTGRHSTDNSLRTNETDGSNRCNNSNTNRELGPHTRYQPRNPKNRYKPYHQR